MKHKLKAALLAVALLGLGAQMPLAAAPVLGPGPTPPPSVSSPGSPPPPSAPAR